MRIQINNFHNITKKKVKRRSQRSRCDSFDNEGGQTTPAPQLQETTAPIYEEEIRVRQFKKITKYESDSIDEDEFKDYFQDPIKRKKFDLQRKRIQMKEMQNIAGFSLNRFGIKNLKALRLALPQSLDERPNNNEEGQKNFATVSLCCLSVTNPFRNNIIQYVLVYPFFERFILFVIFSNCIFLALDKEIDILTANGSTIDFVFLIIYTMEMLLKIVAMGFFMREHSYLRDSWNMLDFLVVFLGWVSLAVNNSSMSGIKVVRTLRPLKAINKIPNMPSLVQTIMKSIPVLMDVGVLFGFMLIFFGAVGTQLLGGHMQGRCTIFNEAGNSTIYLADNIEPIFCYEQDQCDTRQPPGVNSTCLYYGNPMQGTYSYDNVPIAVMNVFIIITLEGWAEMMYYIRHVENTYLYDILFLMIVVSGNFIILNLMIAVQASFLDTAFEEEEQQQRNFEEKEKQKQIILANQIIEENKRAQEDSEFAEESLDKEHQMDGNSKKYIKKKKGLCTDCQKPQLFVTITDKCYYSINQPFFDNIFVIFIILNTICLSLNYYDQPEIITILTGYANYVFTFLFTVEMIIKLFGLGFKGYNEDKANVFDAFIVLMSYIDALMPGDNKNLKILKAFRTMRIFKILKKWKALGVLLDALTGSLIPITNLGILMTTYIFITALMCKQFFGASKLVTEAGTNSRFCFNTTSEALLTMFIFLTGDNWNFIMQQTVYTQGSFIAAPMFMLFLVIGNLILLNLFLGILLRSIKNMNEKAKITELQAALTAQLAEITAQEYQEEIKKKQETLAIEEDQQNHHIEKKLSIREQASDHSANVSHTGKVSLKRKQSEESEPSNLEEDFKYIQEKLEILGNQMAQKIDDTLKRKHKNMKELANALDEIDLRQNLDFDITRKKEKTIEQRKAEEVKQELNCCSSNPNSLFCIPSSSPMRIFLKKFFEDIYYDDFMYHMIGLNSVLLVLDSPAMQDEFQNQTIDLLFNIISGVFVAEGVFKIIAYGFYFEEKSYLKDSWNKLDFSIVIVSILTWVLNAVVQGQVSFIRGFRALRALRPLKIVSKNEKMKTVVNALVEAFPPLMNILLLLLMFMLVFAILGLQLMKGALGSCNNDDYETILMRQNCTGNFTKNTTDLFGIPNGTISVPMVWSVPINAYDNIFQSMLSFFELATVQQWPATLFQAIDAVDYDLSPNLNNNPAMCCLFVVYIFIISFFVLNLFVSIIIEQFNQQIKKKQGSDKFNRQQKEWVKLQRLLIINDPKIIPVEPINSFRLNCFKIVQSQIFEYFVVLVIGISTVVLCMDFYGKSDEFAVILNNMNMSFLIFFVIEGSMKVLAYGFTYYWYINWNKFDFVVVFLSLIVIDESWLVALNIQVAPLRIIRVMRLFRLIKVSEGLRSLLKTVIMSMGNIFTTSMLLMLLLFTFAIIGMSLFGDTPFDVEFNEDVNFTTFYLSMLLLFKVATGEHWTWIMHEAYNTYGLMAVIYWLFFVFATCLIFIKVFIAVIAESFNDSVQVEDDNDILALKKRDIKAFKYTWAKYNPDGNQLMETRRLPEFLRELPPPLGYQGLRIEEIKLNKIIYCLNIRDREGKVYYPEVMWAIFHSISGQNDDSVLKCEQIKSIIRQVENKYRLLGNAVTLDSLCGCKYARSEITASKYIQCRIIMLHMKKAVVKRKQKQLDAQLKQETVLEKKKQAQELLDQQAKQNGTALASKSQVNLDLTTRRSLIQQKDKH